MVMEELQIGELPKHLDDQKFIPATKIEKLMNIECREED
jgi:hypothetical protein